MGRLATNVTRARIQEVARSSSTEYTRCWTPPRADIL
jgi:hypothetical protein